MRRFANWRILDRRNPGEKISHPGLTRSMRIFPVSRSRNSSTSITSMPLSFASRRSRIGRFPRRSSIATTISSASFSIAILVIVSPLIRITSCFSITSSPSAATVATTLNPRRSAFRRIFAIHPALSPAPYTSVRRRKIW